MNLRVVGANLVVSIKSFYREKTAMFFTITFPILLILVFGTVFMDQEKVSFDLHVQDLDGTSASAKLVKTIEASKKFKIHKVDPAINITQYARESKLSLALIIPEGYERSLVQRTQLNDPNASVYPHVHVQSQLYLGAAGDAVPELGACRDKPEHVRQAAVRQVGRDIDTRKEVSVH